MKESACKVIEGGTELTFEMKTGLKIDATLVITTYSILWFFCHWPEALLFGKRIACYNDWKIWTIWRFNESRAMKTWESHQNAWTPFMHFCESNDLRPLAIMQNDMISVSFPLSLGVSFDREAVRNNFILLCDTVSQKV